MAAARDELRLGLPVCFRHRLHFITDAVFGIGRHRFNVS